ncbi:MAG: hypothetical protein JSR72_03755 [Proteobacteria bacterium]|nr:hypothetical protein [Pseudomonadota bacterium]
MAVIRTGPRRRTNRRARSSAAARPIQLLIAVALCLIVTPALAQTAPRSGTGCAAPLAVCTQQRIAHLLEQSRSFARAAALRPPARITPRDRVAINNFDDWLRGASARASNLAQAGRRAKTADMQTSFNLQYLTLQSRLQSESRRFAMVSNIMKAKHDTASNSIGNVR